MDIEVIWKKLLHPLPAKLIYHPHTVDGDYHYSYNLYTLHCDWYKIVVYYPSVSLSPVRNSDDGMGELNLDNNEKYNGKTLKKI